MRIDERVRRQRFAEYEGYVGRAQGIESEISDLLHGADFSYDLTTISNARDRIASLVEERKQVAEEAEDAQSYLESINESPLYSVRTVQDFGWTDIRLEAAERRTHEQERA